jgi:hypothetical protein
MVAGGGVRGKDDGTAHVTITQGGPTIEAFQLSIEKYPQTGGMTTEITSGEDINGITSKYLINRFSKTGGAGKETGTGRINRPGEYRACSLESGRDNHETWSDLNSR